MYVLERSVCLAERMEYEQESRLRDEVLDVQGLDDGAWARVLQ